MESEKNKILLNYDPFPPRQLSVNNTKRIGRNSLCYCGSGRKFKKCHLKAVERLEDESKRCL